MPVVTCFWSLLSLDNLEFLYIPTVVGRRKILNTNQTLEDILLHHSLYEFMHPTEIELAKSDLSNFLNLKILAGSVTRCRLLSLENIACRAAGMEPPSASQTNQGAIVSKPYNDHTTDNVDNMWTVVDIVIYSATHELVLAFFHNIATSDLKSLFASDFGPLCMNEKIARGDDEYSHSNFANQDTLNMIQAVEMVKRMARSDLSRRNNDLKLPKRFFQITDQLAQNVALSWLDTNSSNPDDSLLDMIKLISKDIAVEEFRSSSYNSNCKLITAPFESSTYTKNKDISCTRHFYASVNVELFNKMYNFHKILIPYGSIIFETIQITPLDKSASERRISSSHAQLHLIRQPNQISLPPLNGLSRENGRADKSSKANKEHQLLPISTHILLSNPLTKASTDYNINDKVNAAIYRSVGNRTREDDNLVSRSTGQKSIQLPHLHQNDNAYSSLNQDEEATSSSSVDSYHRQTHHHQQHQQHCLPRMEVCDQLFPNFSAERRKLYGNKRQAFNNRMSGEPVKVCTRCLTSQSPEWRRGPDGHKTLCNACGLRYSRLRSKQWRAALAARDATN
ncbi:hypothetical protein BDF20DRAFT_833099 [Mycotypha africana]|uniref:uncharacterized protein n=1 Tax=Mycotypha africana TaxID=64632 RepID=UPI002301138C|nr:uncharacterized protein BDF20DRAFT_833099 [Mycotypha africana]KAI8988225.1 hypothetical protein BDF20DRAFT_833099 [Mycotypha africana]